MASVTGWNETVLRWVDLFDWICIEFIWVKVFVHLDEVKPEITWVFIEVFFWCTVIWHVGTFGHSNLNCLISYSLSWSLNSNISRFDALNIPFEDYFFIVVATNVKVMRRTSFCLQFNMSRLVGQVVDALIHDRETVVLAYINIFKWPQVLNLKYESNILWNINFHRSNWIAWINVLNTLSNIMIIGINLDSDCISIPNDECIAH